MSEDINKKIGDIQEQARTQYERFLKELDRFQYRAKWYVRFHPRKAMCMAFGAGIITGMVLGAFRRKRMQ